MSLLVCLEFDGIKYQKHLAHSRLMPSITFLSGKLIILSINNDNLLPSKCMLLVMFHVLAKSESESRSIMSDSLQPHGL